MQTEPVPADVAIHPDVTVRRLEPEDLPYLEEEMVREFGAVVLVTRGMMHDPRRLPGLVALRDGHRAGVASYRVQGADCELVAMVGIGVGSELLTAVVHEARRARCRRLWLVTTNDHMRALRFYQRQGNWLAASTRFREVVDRYQTTTHTPEALERLVESYLNLGLPEEAHKAAAVLGANYPGSKWYHRSYELIQRHAPSAVAAQPTS